MKNKGLLTISLILIIIIVIIAFIFVLNNKTTNNSEAQNNSNTETQNKNTTTTQTIMDNASKKMTEQDKSIFNSSFDMYIGKNVKGTRVRSLINTIISSNKNSSLCKVSSIINGEDSTDVNKIVSTKTYSVSFEYNEQGLINKAIIQEN